ncbi:MAG: helix-hairpin-helix domain-containing protein [Lysobacterales bacterium]|nr:helix-hairpin-helix domain-containing protein [Xanthomonadales bacterium]MCP5475157.1 helix-hairpin-helix domain-containing protein [Rhodanobacteraceae bacterium]
MRILKALLLTLALSLPLFAAAAEPVNINTADASTIAANLNGIGDAKARAIVEFRDKNGPFKSADELVKVKGVGLKTVDKNRELIRTSGAPAAKPAKPA